MRFSHFLFTVLFSIYLWGGFASAEYYRWTDKNGDTQYGDQVPAEEVDHGRIKVKDGQVVEKVEPAKSPEELKRYQEEQRIAKIKREIKEEQDAYDRVLLATFNSVEEIEHVRDERVTLIEQSIKLSRSRLRKQEAELSKLSDSRTRFIDRDLQPPEWINRNENKVLSQIAAIEEYIRTRGLEKDKLHRQFDEDIKRYRELTQREITAR